MLRAMMKAIVAILVRRLRRPRRLTLPPAMLLA